MYLRRPGRPGGPGPGPGRTEQEDQDEQDEQDEQDDQDQDDEQAWEAAARRTQPGSWGRRPEASRGGVRRAPRRRFDTCMCHACFQRKKLGPSDAVLSRCARVCAICLCISDASNSAVHVSMSHVGVALLIKIHLTG